MKKSIYCIFIFLIVFIKANYGQNTTLQKIGTYKWVKNKNNSEPVKLNTRVVEKDLSQIITKKEVNKPFFKKISFKKTVIKNGSTVLKKHPISFISKLIKPSLIKTSGKFVYKDNATANITYTDKAHGFISSSVVAIAEDHKHNMWFACADGLVKFDGVRYFSYDKESGLPSIAFSSILFDKSTQKLWVNTAEGFYYIKNDSCYIPKTNLFDIKEFQGNHTSMDNRGNIWFTSRNKGVLCYYNNNTFSLLDTSNGMPTNFIVDVKFDDKNNIYLACLEKGVYVVTPNQIINYLPQHLDVINAGALSLCINKDTVYIGTWSSGLMKLTPKDSTLFSFRKDYTDRIFNITNSKNGIYYTIYRGGLVHYNPSKTEIFNEHNGLVGQYTFGLFIDSYQNIWVNNLEKGIFRINENIFYKQQNLGFLKEITNIRYSANQKYKWLCLNSQSVTQETDSAYISYLVKQDSKSTPLYLYNVTDAFVTNENELWCSTYASGICHITSKKAYFYLYSNIPDDHVLNSTAIASDHKIWFSSQQFGLVYYDFNTKDFYRKYKQNGALSNRCGTLYKLADSSVWTTFDYGMQKIDNTTLYDFYINDSLYQKRINCVFNTKSGKTFIATYSDGLLLLDGKNVYSLNTHSGLASNNVSAIHEDNNQKLWLNTSKGIERLSINEHTVTFDRFFDENYGLFISELIGYSYKNEQGNFSISNASGGIYEFHPENELSKYPETILNINEIYLNNQIINSQSFPKLLSNDHLQINYNVINWGHENEYTHYCLLVSGNGDTTSFVIGEPGSLMLTDLTPNHYKLFIMMKRHHHDFISKPIQFTVSHYWYNSLWFRFFLFLLLLSYFYYLYKQKRNENKRLAKKVEEQTANLLNEKIELEKSNIIILKQNKQKDSLVQEVHHRVKNNLQFISALFQMQINSEKVLGNKAVLSEAFHRLNAITLVHEMLYNKDELEYVAVKEYIHELAIKLNEIVYDKHIPIQFNLNIEDLKFDINHCVAIGMITSEIINNAIKYAFDGISNPTITITLSYNPAEEKITYIIMDNGIGLNKESKTQGLGMRLIEIFARQIDMSYELKNENGVMYIFKIPFIIDEK